MAESISEGILKQWQKKVGDYVEADEEIATIETDKIDVAVNAPEAGKITELLVKEEDSVAVGQDLCKLDTSASRPEGGAQTAKGEPKAPAEPKAQSTSQDSGSQQQKPAEPTPTSQSTSTPSPPPPPPKSQTSAAPSDSLYGNRYEERVKMSMMRRRIAERLKQSQDTAASLTTFNEVDMSQIMELRKKYNPELESNGVGKLGFLSAFCRAVCLAMKAVPAVNASIEGPNGGDTLVFRDYVDISVAVASEKGLVTPVMRNAESLDWLQTEQAINELAAKARTNKITLEDIAGGTFTISNGGVFGSLMGTPIINLPQTAVLGLHAIKERPVAVGGQVVIRPMMYLALTYDHRVLDGREAVTFLVKVKEFIEDPRRMLFPYIPNPDAAPPKKKA